MIKVRTRSALLNQFDQIEAQFAQHTLHLVSEKGVKLSLINRTTNLE
jgi:hypothetical protein